MSGCPFRSVATRAQASWPRSPTAHLDDARPLRGHDRGSCRRLGVEVALPKIDADPIPRTGLGAPQFACVEFNRVTRLPCRPLSMGVGIGKPERTAETSDHAALAARIAGEAGVSLRIEVARHDRVARCKTRRLVRRRFAPSGRWGGKG